MPKAKETVLEIDLGALTHNFNYLKSKIQPNTKFLAVVKAFAYGSDITTIAKHLETLKVDYFAVAYCAEGVALRDAGITTPILVLHPQPVNFKTIINRCLEPSVYSERLLREFITAAKAEKQVHYPVHLKFNTGLNRLGFKRDDLEIIAKHFSSTSSVYCKSIFSHLAASEASEERLFTEQQILEFQGLYDACQKFLDDAPIKHLCNTSGVLNYPKAHYDMVRCGIGLYGFGNSATFDAHLKPVARLKSVISQIHQVHAGDTVGYNRAYKASKEERIATIPIGHADGINRSFGHGKGYVFINEKKASIVGNVCMDMIMVNVSNIDCKEGDEVIVFNGKHKASTLAESAHTISYEILTAISQRIKRQLL